MSERFVIEAADERERVDKALARLLAPTSRATIQRWIAEGRIKIAGVVCRPRDLVGEGAVIDVERGPELTSNAEPDASVPFDVVYEDAHLIVVSKPAGIVVHPARGHRTGTLVSGLLARPGFTIAPADERDPEGKLRPGIVHRIDKDTSGLLVVARTLAAHTALVAALAAHEVEREYLAVCTGVMTGGGTVDEKIGRHRTQRIKMTVRSDGREAVTHYRLEKKFRAHTLARVRLETGRTHQIRVHLAHIGYPIVGDPVYGGRKRVPKGATPALIKALDAFQRQALHAAKLSFTHPKSGKAVSYEAPLPKDLKGLLAALAKDAEESDE